MNAAAAKTPDFTPWDDTPFIELPVFRAYCPACGAFEHKIVRTPDNGDGTKTRRAECLACGKRYRATVAVDPLPAAGNWTFPTPYDSPQMSTATTNIVAVGQVATTLRTTVATIAKAAEALGVRPCMTINGIPFLDADDVERIRKHLEGSR